MSSKTKSVDLTNATTSANLQRERDLVMETYSTLYEKYGETAAAEFLKENKKIAEHLIPLRKMIESEISKRLGDAKESQSILEVHLTEFKKSIPSDAADEMAAFNSVIKLVRKANPESIRYLKQFSRVITWLVDHMSYYSEGVNPKFKQCRALKKALDEMFMREIDHLEIAPTPPANGKRKAAELKRAAGGDKVAEENKDDGLSIAESESSNVDHGAVGEFDDASSSAKKAKGGFAYFLGGLLSSERGLLDAETN